MASTKNNGTTQPKPVEANIEGLPDFSKFVETSTGFPPYWNPSVGLKAFGRVIGIDYRDRTFPRYTLIAGMDMACFSGPNDDRVPVAVKKGEKFNVSVYARLPLDIFIGEEVLFEATKKVKGGGGEVWHFKMMSTPEAKAIAAKRTSLFFWAGEGAKPVLNMSPAAMESAGFIDTRVLPAKGAEASA